MTEFYVGMVAITAAFIWGRFPPHKDWFEFLMLVSCSVLWPLLLGYAGYRFWADSKAQPSPGD